jgi:hypothetical protein
MVIISVISILLRRSVITSPDLPDGSIGRAQTEIKAKVGVGEFDSTRSFRDGPVLTGSASSGVTQAVVTMFPTFQLELDLSIALHGTPTHMTRACPSDAAPLTVKHLVLSPFQ